MWFKSLLARNKPKYSSTFSDFIRNASSAEKKKVYTEVMKKASERQNTILASAKHFPPETA